MALTLFAWLMVFLNRDFRATRAAVKPCRRLRPIGLAQLGRTLGWAMLAGPLAALAALLPWLAWAAWLPGDAANRLVPGIFLFIVSWAALSFWILASPRPWRPGLSIIALIGLCGVLLSRGGQA